MILLKRKRRKRKRRKRKKRKRKRLKKRKRKIKSNRFCARDATTSRCCNRFPSIKFEVHHEESQDHHIPRKNPYMNKSDSW